MHTLPLWCSASWLVPYYSYIVMEEFRRQSKPVHTTIKCCTIYHQLSLQWAKEFHQCIFTDICGLQPELLFSVGLLQVLRFPATAIRQMDNGQRHWTWKRWSTFKLESVVRWRLSAIKVELQLQYPCWYQAPIQTRWQRWESRILPLHQCSSLCDMKQTHPSTN